MFSILLFGLSVIMIAYALLTYLFHPQKGGVLPLMLCGLLNSLPPVLIIICLHLNPSVINVIEC